MARVRSSRALGILWTGGGTDASLGAKAMTREDLLLRISVDPNVCFGKPCVRGHRIWVSLILDLLASGSTRGRSWTTTLA